MAEEKTYAMIKPDGVRKGHVGEIISRFEKAGLGFMHMEYGMITQFQAEENYIEHQGKPYYNDLITYMTSGPVVKMVITGENAVEKVRQLIGDTDPLKALPGTIRADFATDETQNIVHGADSVKSADREMRIFFPNIKRF